jgi:uncharacterized protein YlzI (FlbEa/FlbD family)
MQGDLLYEKVEQVLLESDAVICVINGKQLKNQAQQSVQDLITKMAKFDMQENIMVRHITATVTVFLFEFPC